MISRAFEGGDLVSQPSVRGQAAEQPTLEAYQPPGQAAPAGQVAVEQGVVLAHRLSPPLTLERPAPLLRFTSNPVRWASSTLCISAIR